MNDSETDLGLMDADALVALYRKGQASPVDATRAALDRIERFNGAVNAYIHVDADGALDAPHASARRWNQGRQLSAIDGAPVSLKDLTEVRGLPIGFQLAAGKYDDTRILRACKAYTDRYPPRFPEAPDAERQPAES